MGTPAADRVEAETSEPSETGKIHEQPRTGASPPQAAAKLVRRPDESAVAGKPARDGSSDQAGLGQKPPTTDRRKGDAGRPADKLGRTSRSDQPGRPEAPQRSTRAEVPADDRDIRRLSPPTDPTPRGVDRLQQALRRSDGRGHLPSGGAGPTPMKAGDRPGMPKDIRVSRDTTLRGQRMTAKPVQQDVAPTPPAPHSRTSDMPPNNRPTPTARVAEAVTSTASDHVHPQRADAGMPTAKIGELRDRTGATNRTGHAPTSGTPADQAGGGLRAERVGEDRRSAPAEDKGTREAEGKTSDRLSAQRAPSESGNGTIGLRHADGALQQRQADGTNTFTSPSGATITAHPRGAYAASFEATIIRVTPDGDIVARTKDGYTVTTSPRGDMWVESPDGGTRGISRDGTISVSDGKGWSMNTSADGSQVTTTNTDADGTTHTEGSHGSGSWSSVTHNGTEVATYRDGTKVETAPDGTTHIRRPDGTVSTTTPDGMTVLIRPDGRAYHKNPDGTRYVPAVNEPGLEPSIDLGKAVKSVARGVWESGRDFAKFMYETSYIRQQIDPEGWAKTMLEIVSNMRDAAEKPDKFALAIIDWETWEDDPFRALGHLVADILINFLSGGAGASGRVRKTEAAISQLDNAPRKGASASAEAGQAAGREKASDLAETHAYPRTSPLAGDANLRARPETGEIRNRRPPGTTLPPGKGDLEPGRSPLGEGDIDAAGSGSGKKGSRVGDRQQMHEPWHNADLINRMVDKARGGSVQRKNPAVALSDELHKRVTAEQRTLGLFEEALTLKMTVQEVIDLNATAMRNAGVPREVVQEARREALRFAEKHGKVSAAELAEIASREHWNLELDF